VIDWQSNENKKAARIWLPFFSLVPSWNVEYCQPVLGRLKGKIIRSSCRRSR